MSPAKRDARKQAKARQRRRRTVQERLDRDRRQAQQAVEALHQALEELGLPDNLVSEIEGRLNSQQHRVLSGIDGLLLVVVIGDGKLVAPVDFAIRRPNPIGAGAPCRAKLTWARTMIDDRLSALRNRGLEFPPPISTSDSWFSDSKLMSHVRQQHQGTLLVEGKVSYTFTLADGRHVNGHDFLEGE